MSAASSEKRQGADTGLKAQVPIEALAFIVAGLASAVAAPLGAALSALLHLPGGL